MVFLEDLKENKEYYILLDYSLEFLVVKPNNYTIAQLELGEKIDKAKFDILNRNGYTISVDINDEQLDNIYEKKSEAELMFLTQIEKKLKEQIDLDLKDVYNKFVELAKEYPEKFI